jgi:hypothetical protein
MTKGNREEDNQHNRTESLPRHVHNPICVHILLSISQAKANTRSLCLNNCPKAGVGWWMGWHETQFSTSITRKQTLFKNLFGVCQGVSSCLRLSTSTSYDVSTWLDGIHARGGWRQRSCRPLLPLSGSPDEERTTHPSPTQISCDLSNSPFPFSVYIGISSESAPTGMVILCGSCEIHQNPSRV